MSDSSPPSPPSSPPSSLSESPTLTTPGKAWITLSVFLVVVGIFQWGSVLRAKLAKKRCPSRDPDEEATHTSILPPANGGWIIARLPLALVNAFRVIAFRWTLEFGSYDLKLVDVLLTLAYLAFLFGWTFEGAAEIGVAGLNLSVWSGQAGILAASQFPLITILGTKNNIISAVTGIGHEKLNYFHRVAARSCFALLLFHAGGEIYSSKSVGELNDDLQHPFLRLGLTAVTALMILTIISIRALRTRAYEFFFYSHFVLVVIVMVAAYFHTREVDASYWIWPSFMFWALDRFMRVARVVACNHQYIGFGERAQDVTTELLSDDFIRVKVRRPLHFRWSPGQIAYIVMPSVSSFPLEAHPFSIASLDSTIFHNATGEHFASSDETKDVAPSAHWKELVFLISIRGGFTRRLKEIAAQNQNVKLFIDGPYGRAPDMGAYDTSIFIAGGSGITYTLPVFLDVIDQARKGVTQCRRVVFIWAVRDASHVQWISDALYQSHAVTPTWLNVSIRIFATRGALPFSKHSVDPECTPEKENREWATPPSVRMENGRPDLQAILRGEVSTAMGSMSVTVCGPQGMTRSVRRALRFPVSGPSSILSGGPSVTLHVESFGYA